MTDTPKQETVVRLDGDQLLQTIANLVSGMAELMILVAAMKMQLQRLEKKNKPRGFQP